MPQDVVFSENPGEAMLRGVNSTAIPMIAALGPNDVYRRPRKNTIAKHVELSDPFENMGAQMVYEVASKTMNEAGDGGATATVLAQCIFREGVIAAAAGSSRTALKSGIEKAVAAIITRMANSAHPVSGEAVARVGTFSVDGDAVTGRLIADALSRAGRDGVITVEESNAVSSELHSVRGMQFDRGYVSHYFVTDVEREEAVLEEPYILIYEDAISQIEQLATASGGGILAEVAQSGKPLLIVAEDVTGIALATLVINKIRGVLKCCAVKGPATGYRRIAMLEDLAAITGGTVIRESGGIRLEELRLEHLGRAARVIVDKARTTIVDGAGDEQRIEQRIDLMRAQLARPLTEYDRVKLEDRLATLEGRVTVLQVGAATEAELSGKRAKVEDALRITRAAVEEGVVQGGGVALLRAAQSLAGFHLAGDEQIGVDIVRRACLEPLRQIADNSGVDGTVVLRDVSNFENPYIGFNARTRRYENLMESGIVDPLKVTRLALQNAASIAAFQLTEETPILDVPETFEKFGQPPLPAESTVRIGETYPIAPSSPPPPEPPGPPEDADPPGGNGADAPHRAFYFALEGNGAHGDQVLWDAAFDLVFGYDVPPADVLAELIGAKLDEQLTKTKVTLRIDVDPIGLLPADDSAGRFAVFENGTLAGDKPRFHLKAPPKGSLAANDPCGVDISFYANRVFLYKVFLPVRAVDRLDENAAAVKRRIDLDVADVYASNAWKRDAVLAISKVGGAWTVSCDTGVTAFYHEHAQIGPADLADQYKVKNIIDDITQIAESEVWKAIDEHLDVPQTKDMQDDALKCMRILMTAGYKLYRILGADPTFKKALALIEQLDDNSRITIQTDGDAFPWELLYPLPYYYTNPEENFQPGRFWGKRFQIEQLIYGAGEGEKLPRDRRQPGNLQVSVGFDKGIDVDWAGFLYQPVDTQIKTFPQFLSGHWEQKETEDEIAAFMAKDYPASFIYLFCHGDENHLKFQESGWGLGSESILAPPLYSRWPLVFLNACSAGNISPLAFSSFRTEFRRKKAAGLVAASFPIPSLFAAFFGTRVLREYVKRRPIGDILFELRGQLLAKGNPLGLLYSLQCPLDVSAPVN